jgi:L-aspartate semialdehyde sulfurtransferase ferredoxin
MADKVRRKVYLTFPHQQIQKPIVWQLGKDFDIVTNIRYASVSGDTALVGLGLEGTEAEIKRGLDWLESIGVRVEPIELGVVE